MAFVARRLVLTGAVSAAAATLAAAWALRKPAAPPLFTPKQGPDEAGVELQPMTALVLSDPPKSVSPITFADAAGTAHSLAEFAGRGVVLNLWATWCMPCVAELPALARLAQAVAGEGIVVLPLSTDRGGAALVQRFFDSHKLTGLGVWVDPKGAATEALGLRGIPTTLLIDHAGRERARLEGAADWAAPDALAAVRKLTS